MDFDCIKLLKHSFRGLNLEENKAAKTLLLHVAVIKNSIHFPAIKPLFLKQLLLQQLNLRINMLSRI